LQTENHRARWSLQIPSPAAHWDLERGQGPQPGDPLADLGLASAIPTAHCSFSCSLLGLGRRGTCQLLWGSGGLKPLGDTEASDANRASDQARTTRAPGSLGVACQREPRGSEQNGLLPRKTEPLHVHLGSFLLGDPRTKLKVPFLRTRKVIWGNHSQDQHPLSFVSALLTHMNSFS